MKRQQSKTPKTSNRGVSAQPSFGMEPNGKYCSYLSDLPVSLPDRQWPARQLTKAPRWCSVDLRDGNQALIRPMELDLKVRLFELLVRIGFKEIEIGFPSANDVEFGFTRHLINNKMLPVDVVPQVLTQARGALIRRTFESLEGARAAIVHVYNPTSRQQRKIVYRTDVDGVRATAVESVRLVRELAEKSATKITLEYSPESFTATELDVALGISNAVVDVWEPCDERPLILNLPATVELATPNVYADQIEWFGRHIKHRSKLAISLHTHNDRGTAVAATELGLMAGGDRVEGTLFGNGERTGNVDIVTLALNLFSQGINPCLDFSEMKQIVDTVSGCNDLPIHPRHPYAGQLVFTAFSGSHQFAIDRGLTHRGLNSSARWDVPYLPIDPSDIGRDYEADAIRINNQSGGYGVAHILRVNYDWHVPKALTREFTDTVVKSAGSTDITAELGERFQREFVHRDTPFRFVDFTVASGDEDTDEITCCLTIESRSETRRLTGRGKSPLLACRDALFSSGCIPFEIVSCHKHSTNADADPQAIAYVQIETEDRRRRYGAGIDANANRATAKAIVSAVNRACEIRTYVRADFEKALSSEYHCKIPDDMRQEFEAAMGTIPNALTSELPASTIWHAFKKEFVDPPGPIEFIGVQIVSEGAAKLCKLRLRINGEELTLSGKGNGTIDSCIHALHSADFGEDLGRIEVAGGGYHASTTGESAAVAGIAFVNINAEGRGRKYGVGIHENTIYADVKAVISALNRTLQTRPQAPENFVAVMESEFGFRIPEGMQNEFHQQMHARAGREKPPYSAKWLWEQFTSEFVERTKPYELLAFDWQTSEKDPKQITCQLQVKFSGKESSQSASGVGILDAASSALIEIAAQNNSSRPEFRLLDFQEQSLGSGTQADAIAFISIDLDHHGIKYGVGIDRDVTTARIKALLSAINRSYRKHEYCEYEFFDAMRSEFGYEIPDEMFADFTDAMKPIIPPSGDAVPTSRIWDRFAGEYLKRSKPFQVVRSLTFSDANESGMDVCELALDFNGRRHQGVGRGMNAVAACQDALSRFGCPEFEMLYFGEHSRFGAKAESIAFVQIDVKGQGRAFGVGLSQNPDHASIKAVFSALNRVGDSGSKG